mmetsp:Transcript_24391/g.34967  ORF Transcript_24391/g.34967 Transcript_24391/m.34967 type:complete len:699 (+) Transcript_24391:48-2144(+)|eukprot:CAMPEP_0172431506 /NCGR_PEP_ID=MMETSP1064-20121228/58763_1 /TAXON_ID=202472 /ORGANISM="Aulacoseira subarctica , Strain CCAP 1002/5" /LENGTH=698 /DNA_ID=CAMNT_0013178233 /DNA_START=48 /DNA_END=2144 /DNA_ORIENTATION=-
MPFFAWFTALSPSSTCSSSTNQTYSQRSCALWSFIGGAAISSLVWGCVVYCFSSSQHKILPSSYRPKIKPDLDAFDDSDKNAEKITNETNSTNPSSRARQKLLKVSTSGRNILQSLIKRSCDQVIRRSRWPWDRKRKSKESWDDPYAFTTVRRSVNSKENAGSTNDATAMYPQKKKRQRSSDTIDIGNIFGLDVGGTLVKLVYFEKRNEPAHFSMTSSRHRHRRGATAASKSFYMPMSTNEDCTSFSTDSLPKLSSDYGGQNDELKNEKMHKDSILEEAFAYDTDSTQDSSSMSSMKRSSSMLQFSFQNNTQKALDTFYSFASSIDSYMSEDDDATGVKDVHLNFYSRELRGEFHFIGFETRRMTEAMQLIQKYDMHANIYCMGATGGGAHKYAKDWEDGLGIRMEKYDELDSLVAGMQFILSDVVGECHTFIPDDTATSPPTANNVFTSPQVDDWWWSRKVKRDMAAESSTYPYLLVTIGTGVSILRVDGPRKYERISGSTIGGGTYWGLCRLLCEAETFKGALNLASRGDPTKVDMMVGDIYGKSDGDALLKLGLSSSTVASSFGKLVAKSDPAEGLKEEDLARALLMMVTNNIGQVAYLNAKLHGMSRIYFVGNFLRQNQISQQRLAFAINYWSKGEMEALFLEHEGYFGALGAFLLTQKLGEQPPRQQCNVESQLDLGLQRNIHTITRCRSNSV